MLIAFDAREVRAGMTGVGRYAARLAERLPVVRPDLRFLVFGLQDDSEAAVLRERIASFPNVAWRSVAAHPERHPATDWWLHRRLPRLLEEAQADVHHGPAFAVPAGPRPPDVARVATVHDLGVFTTPGVSSWKFRTYMRWTIRRTLRAADAVLFDAESVRRLALERFPRFDGARSAVVPLAPCLNVCKGERAPAAEQDFFLMVGTFETRKNPVWFAEFLDAWLAVRGPTPPPCVVWAGRRGRGAAAALRRLAPHVQAGRFRLMDGIDDDALRRLYRSAAALVYPSLDEGFGLPLLEAMAAGLPVVASNRGCIPETVGPGGAVLSLGNPDDWIHVLGALLDDPVTGAEARAQAERRAREFSWDRTARETAAVYEQAHRLRHAAAR